MQHTPATDILEFLNDRCHSLARLQSNLANQILGNTPSVSVSAAFVRDVARVQEQLSRCQSLRGRFEAVGADVDVRLLLEQEMAQVDARITQHLEAIRAEPTRLEAKLAQESVAVLLELHEAFDRLMDETRAVA
jgi:hypothetical protein